MEAETSHWRLIAVVAAGMVLSVQVWIDVDYMIVAKGLSRLELAVRELAKKHDELENKLRDLTAQTRFDIMQVDKQIIQAEMLRRTMVERQSALSYRLMQIVKKVNALIHHQENLEDIDTDGWRQD